MSNPASRAHKEIDAVMYERTMSRLRLMIVVLSAALLGQILRTFTHGMSLAGGVSEGVTTSLLLFAVGVWRQGLRLKDNGSISRVQAARDK